jgi:hypothetical protein
MAPEKHLHLARLYEKLGEQLDVTAQTRLEFDRKAKWHRILARSSSSLERLTVPQARTEVDREAFLFSPVRLSQARTYSGCEEG